MYANKQAEPTAGPPTTLQRCCRLDKSDKYELLAVVLRGSCLPSSVPRKCGGLSNKGLWVHSAIAAMTPPTERCVLSQLARPLCHLRLCMSCCCAVTAAANEEWFIADCLSRRRHSKQRCSAEAVLCPACDERIWILAAASCCIAAADLRCCRRSVGKGEEAVGSEG